MNNELKRLMKSMPYDILSYMLIYIGGIIVFFTVFCMGVGIIGSILVTMCYGFIMDSVAKGVGKDGI